MHVFILMGRVSLLEIQSSLLLQLVQFRQVTTYLGLLDFVVYRSVTIYIQFCLIILGFLTLPVYLNGLQVTYLKFRILLVDLQFYL